MYLAAVACTNSKKTVIIDVNTRYRIDLKSPKEYTTAFLTNNVL